MSTFTYVRITEKYKQKVCHNPASGHSWPEPVGKPRYIVSGPFGVISSHASESAALAAAQSWDDFYMKYPVGLPSKES